MASYTNITSANQHTTLVQGNTHVLLDFTATWCPPCKAIAPIFEQLAHQHAADGQLAFAKVDVDANPELAAQYGITAMPTFVLVKRGEVAGSVKGASPQGIKALIGQASA